MRAQEALSELSLLFDNARRALERASSRFAGQFGPAERTPYMEMALALEPLRFRLAESNDRYLKDYQALEIYKQTMGDLEKVLHDPVFRRFGEDISWPNYRAPKGRSNTLREVLDNRKLLSFNDGIRRFIFAIDREFEFEEPKVIQPELELEATSALRRALPPQQPIAPVQFDISDNRLVIKHQRATAAPQDKANVEAARASLLATGRRIRKAIEESNDDIRLAQTLDEIHRALSSDQDIINLGLMNFVLDAVRESLECELAVSIR